MAEAPKRRPPPPRAKAPPGRGAEESGPIMDKLCGDSADLQAVKEYINKTFTDEERDDLQEHFNNIKEINDTTTGDLLFGEDDLDTFA